jgi:hypothetical protein
VDVDDPGRTLPPHPLAADNDREMDLPPAMGAEMRGALAIVPELRMRRRHHEESESSTLGTPVP